MRELSAFIQGACGGFGLTVAAFLYSPVYTVALGAVLLTLAFLAYYFERRGSPVGGGPDA